MPFRVPLAIGGLCEMVKTLFGIIAVTTGSGAAVLAESGTTTLTLDMQTVVTIVGMVVGGGWVIAYAIQQFTGERAASSAEIANLKEQIRVLDDRVRALTRIVESQDE